MKLKKKKIAKFQIYIAVASACASNETVHTLRNFQSKPFLSHRSNFRFRNMIQPD